MNGISMNKGSGVISLVPLSPNMHMGLSAHRYPLSKLNKQHAETRCFCCNPYDLLQLYYAEDYTEPCEMGCRVRSSCALLLTWQMPGVLLVVVIRRCLFIFVLPSASLSPLMTSCRVRLVPRSGLVVVKDDIGVPRLFFWRFLQLA